MKIQETSQVGNFLVGVTVEVAGEFDKPAQAILAKGVRWLMQRKGGVDELLGGMVPGTAKSGKPRMVRREKWTRNDTPYGDLLAQKLQMHFATLEYPGEDEMAAVVCAEVSVTEYIRDVAESKFNDERVIASNHESKNDLEEWLEKTVGYTGATHGEDGEFEVGMLRAIRGYKLAKAKELLASI